MNDGHCPACNQLYYIVSNGNIQRWVCQNQQCLEYNKIKYRPISVLEVFNTYDEAAKAWQTSLG